MKLKDPFCKVHTSNKFQLLFFVNVSNIRSNIYSSLQGKACVTVMLNDLRAHTILGNLVTSKQDAYDKQKNLVHMDDNVVGSVSN